MPSLVIAGYGNNALLPSFGYGGGTAGVATPTFAVDSLEILDPQILRVRFNRPPLVSTGTSSERGNVTTNYTLSNGTTTIALTMASAVSSDNEVIDLYLATPLAIGIWTLTVASTLLATNLAPLVSPYSIAFEVASITNPSLSDGATNNDCMQTLQSYFNPVFRNKESWKNVLRAIAKGYCVVGEVVEGAKAQYWLSSASGKYLTYQAGNYGIRKPKDTGITDAAFRELAIAIKNRKLTQQAFLGILGIIYGDSAVRAQVTSKEGPFVLFEGATLNLLIDGATTATIQFTRSQFRILRRATANEVAAAINKRLLDLGASAYATAYSDPVNDTEVVKIFSATAGLRSSIAVAPSTAQTALAFNTSLFDSTAYTLPTWTVTVPTSGTTRFTPSQGLVYPATEVEIGDYIVITGAEFAAANRGAHVITDVHYESGSNQWFDVTLQGTAETLVQVDFDSFRIFRPSRQTVYSNSNGVVVTQTNGVSRVSIPTTSAIVSRDVETGTYLNDRTPVSGTVVRNGALLQIETTTPHGMSPGDQFELRSDPSLTVPTPIGASGSSAYTPSEEAIGTGGTISVTTVRNDSTFEGALYKAATDSLGRAWILGGQTETPSAWSPKNYATVFEAIPDEDSYTYSWFQIPTALTPALGAAISVPNAAPLAGKVLSTGGYATHPWANYSDNFIVSSQSLFSKIPVSPPALVLSQFNNFATGGLLAAMGYWFSTNPGSGQVLTVTDGATSRTYGWGVGGVVTVPIGATPYDTMVNLVSAINGDFSAPCTAVLVTTMPEIATAFVVLVEKNVLAARSGLRIYGNVTSQINHHVVTYSYAGGVHYYDNPTQIQLPLVDPGYGHAGFHRIKPSLVPNETHKVLSTNTYYRWTGFNWLTTFSWISEINTGGLPNPVADATTAILDTYVLITGGSTEPNVAISSVAKWNQSTATSSTAGNMIEARLGHSAVRISTTTAFVVGGRRPASLASRTALSYSNWEFNDAAASATAAGPVAVTYGANPRVIGKMGHGLRLSASAASAAAPNGTLNTQLRGNYTISGWMTAGTGTVLKCGVTTPGGAADNTLIEFGVDPADDLFVVRWMYGANTVVTKKSTSPYTSLMGSTQLDPPRYHHFAITKTDDGATTYVSLYINGVLANLWTDTKPDSGANAVWAFGVTGAMARFTGAIDTIGITSTVLTAAQIAEQYVQEVGVTYDNPAGATLSPMGTVLNTTELVTISTATRSGPMASCRAHAGIIALPDGRILACGGVGYPATRPTPDLPQKDCELKTAEIWSPYTGTWSKLPDMPAAHSYFTPVLDAVNNRVYCSGGFTSTAIEYLDLRTMTWGRMATTLPRLAARGATASASGIILNPGGSQESDGTFVTSPGGSHWQPLSESVYSGGLNGTFTATATGSTTIQAIAGIASYGTAAVEVIPIGATTGIGTGYLQEYGAPGVGAINGTIQGSIKSGASVSSIVLGSTEATPFGTSGIAVIGLGTLYETRIKYSAIDANTLGTTFVAPSTIPVGAEIRILYATPLDFRPPWATASDAGRRAAIDILNRISASGFDLEITTRYPSDRGLGGEGFPTEGQKTSDKVEVWG